ncbi:MAG: cell division protein ZapB [Trichloromonas sp.]|jgi:FtsZ-binding cell division protein ZapB|nr:cell division protein ZapB [Trichloromonas sp.]
MASDTLELIIRLEEKLTRLLDRQNELGRRVRELEQENQALLEERRTSRDELDRIIGRLDLLDEEAF